MHTWIRRQSRFEHVSELDERSLLLSEVVCPDRNKHPVLVYIAEKIIEVPLFAFLIERVTLKVEENVTRVWVW